MSIPSRSGILRRARIRGIACSPSTPFTPRTGSSTAVMASAQTEGRTAVTEFPDRSAAAQEGLDPLMQAVDGLDMQFAADALAGRQVQRLIAARQSG